MKKILSILLFLTCFSVIAQEESPLFFKDGDKTVRLEFENNAKYLEVNKPTEMKVYVENIDRKRCATSGRNMRPIGNCKKGDCFIYSVTVDPKWVENGSYKITFIYPAAEGNERKVCTFLVPVKQ